MNSVQVMVQLQQQFGTADWQNWNIYWQPYYDLVGYPTAGATQLDVFAVPAGQNEPNGAWQKTAEDTNCTVPRQLGQNYLICTEIRTGVFLRPKARQPNAIATDASLIYGTIRGMGSKWLELFNRGILTITIDSKQYLQLNAPFNRAPFGAGLSITHHGSQAAAGPAVAVTPWIQNNSDEANVFKLTPPLFIAPQQIINVQFSWPDATGPVFTNLVDSASPLLQLGVFLGGYMVRASQ